MPIVHFAPGTIIYQGPLLSPNTHKPFGMYGRHVGTRTPDLYRVKVAL